MSSQFPIAEPNVPTSQGYGAVADTTAVVLHLENRRMPPDAKAFFTRAEQAQGALGIAAITLAEIGYLAEKGRIKLNPADVVAYTLYDGGSTRATTYRGRRAGGFPYH